MADLLLGRTVSESDPQDVSVGTGDLVTHGVIVGMTGSGKTGLGVVLIEEALAAGVPALLFDPKGDLTNLTLVFPGLTGPEFEPWVDPAQAKADGTDVPQFAEKQATLWRDGLAGWGIGPEQMAQFAGAIDVSIYTPGSTAGIPLNILGSLTAPQTTDTEVMADEIEGYVTSLLNVVGITADPLSSREHILLSNIIHAAWSAGEDIDLPTLLARVQQPPMRKLGVFELDQFFPPKDRMEFAMRLNAVLAAPGFQSWITGDPIDIQNMLFGADGRARCAVITTAHLSDEDRQSATSLILSKVVTWMRRQSGTTDLRALLYLDEVAGYLPPTANPPTKKPIMLLMKQARAFGLGVVLSTQNPVDVDYKALSNAGTWMIGRLTTERDKARLLEGMSSAAGGVDVAAVSESISALGKRQFLIRKAGRNDVETFGTKWARSYLRGPMTRDQIAQVMATRGSAAAAPAPTPAATPAAPAEVPAADVAAPPAEPAVPESGAAPVVDTLPPVAGATAAPLGDDETPVMPQPAPGTAFAFLDPAAPWAASVGAVAPTGSGQRLVAGAAARVMLRYDDARAGVTHDEEYEAIVFPLPEHTATLTPIVVDYDDRDLTTTAPAAARFALPLAKVDTKTYWTQLRRDLTDFLVRSKTVEVFANKALKAYSRVGESAEEFTQRCSQIAMAEADRKVAALQTKYESKVRALQTRLATASGQVQAAESARNQGVLGDAASVIGGFLGGRRSTSSIAAAARRAQTAQNRANTAQAKVDDLQAQITDVEAQLTNEVYDIQAEWQAKAAEIVPVPITLAKSDVRIVDLRLIWVPVA
ncbi:MAG: DUF87 domain-containing protein [Candidatus Nanopelagicales bacterium]